MQPKRVTLLFLACAALAHASACSSSKNEPETCTAYVVPQGTDLTAPKVTFKADVAPILVKSCTDQACHGSKASSEGIYLPANSPDEMYAALTGPATSTLAMGVTTAGSPEKSFLMRKLDGDQCTVTCVKGGCGARMPPDAPLPVAARDTIRRWIAQGAKKD